MAQETLEFARLLDACRHGDADASARLIRQVYADLQRLARAQRGQLGGTPTMNTTSLVHECYLRIAGPVVGHVESRNHFFNLASRVMRQVLCDYARQRLADKRGGGQVQVTESAIDAEGHGEATELIEIDNLLDRLELEHERAARVFECRYFAGLGEQETADALGVSLRTAQREWNLARGWLAERLAG
ncbi:MAG: sigma-70 family RNA polymerase sigma factor [Xanthomonadales bacterium]|nr:sigma-70 family RNA polymerase sigma factor [Xanthomonadales bacterium]